MTCGVYLIVCKPTGKSYVGSSKQIPARWTQHRRVLNAGKSNSRYLQHAWSKHGENAFEFSILEYCAVDELEIREQNFIDALLPELNIITSVKRRYGAEMLARRAAAIRARALTITQCPRGHAYDEANTYRNAKGKRICRACNALRVANVYANETPEEREMRRRRAKAYYQGPSHENLLSQQRAYQAARKDHKREYDRQRRERIKLERPPA